MIIKRTIYVVVILILALLCLDLFMPRPAIECNFANTINITDGHRFKNGSYEFYNVIYDVTKVTTLSSIKIVKKKLLKHT